MELLFVDDQRQPDWLLQKMIGESNILGRGWVIHQWLSVLSALNIDGYGGLDVPPIEVVCDAVTAGNERVAEALVQINDRDAVSFENAIGSDVAQVQITEAPQNSGQCEQQTCCSDDDSNGELSDEEVPNAIPLRHSYICMQPEMVMDGDTTRKQQLSAIETLLQDGSTETGESDELSDHLRMSERNPVSVRASQPVNEIENKDEMLAAFPTCSYWAEHTENAWAITPITSVTIYCTSSPTYLRGTR